MLWKPFHDKPSYQNPNETATDLQSIVPQLQRFDRAIYFWKKKCSQDTQADESAMNIIRGLYKIELLLAFPVGSRANETQNRGTQTEVAYNAVASTIRECGDPKTRKIRDFYPKKLPIRLVWQKTPPQDTTITARFC